VNSFAPVNPKLFDLFPKDHDGYPDHLAAEDTPDNLFAACGAASREFPDSWWIEPKDWPDAARDNDKYKTWPVNRIDRFTNQNPTHECTVHSLTRCIEGCWNLQRGIIYPQGPKKNFRYPESASLGSVWFSVLSVYAEANPRQWGGANVRQVAEIAARRGILPDKMQPRDYGFKHTLTGTAGEGNSNQSSGPWIPLSRFPDGWEETAKQFIVEEIVFPRSYEQAVCCVLRNRFVGVGRNGHAVPWGRYLPGQGMEYPDSYNLFRYDSERTVKSAWSGSFCIASMRMPDDWDKPGGAA